MNTIRDQLLERIASAVERIAANGEQLLEHQRQIAAEMRGSQTRADARVRKLLAAKLPQLFGTNKEDKHDD